MNFIVIDVISVVINLMSFFLVVQMWLTVSINSTHKLKTAMKVFWFVLGMGAFCWMLICFGLTAQSIFSKVYLLLIGCGQIAIFWIVNRNYSKIVNWMFRILERKSKRKVFVNYVRY